MLKQRFGIPALLALMKPVVAVSLLFIVGCKDKPEVIEYTPLVKYEVAQLAEDRQKRSLSGIVKAAHSSVLSFQVDGTIKAVHVTNGTAVKQGQVLAQLDDSEYRRSLEKAMADLAARQSDFNERRTSLERNEELWKQHTISRAQFTAEQTAFDAATSALRIAEIQVENARKDLADTKLIAPFDGVIASRKVDPFIEIKSGKDAFVIDSPNELEVRVLVPETMVRRVYYGQQVEVRFPTIRGVMVKGNVSEIGAQVETGNAFPVKVTLGQSSIDIRSGMTASATFLMKQENGPVYLVPVTAFAINDAPLGMLRQENMSLFVFDKTSSTLKKRHVTLGGAVGDRVEVIEGLNPGDIIVVAGVPFLREGMTVKLWEKS